MRIQFKTKRDLALMSFVVAIILAFIIPVDHPSLLILVVGIGVLSTFLVDKLYDLRYTTPQEE